MDDFPTESKRLLVNIIAQSRSSGILLSKLFLPNVRKNCSSDREKLLKFEAEGREFANFLRSLEQFLVTEYFFNLFLDVSQI